MTRFLCLLFLVLSSTLTLAAQEESRFHSGVFAEVSSSRMLVDDPFNTSEVRTGVALGYYQHFDLSARLQLRFGGALSNYSIGGRDYSITFGSDGTPEAGVDIYASYLDFTSDIVQLNVPVNVRYKVFGSKHHLYIGGGLEGRFPLHEDAELWLVESRQPSRQVSSSSFQSKLPGLAGQAEIGYEFPLGRFKGNIGAFSKYALTSQFKSDFLFSPVTNYHLWEFGVGGGFIF